MSLRYPLDKVTFTQSFGGNASFYKKYGQLGHNGFDLRAAVGTKVFAADDGVIAFEGMGANHSWMGAIAGICAIIKHAGCYTGYAHLKSTIVNKGQKVKKGQLIGYSGATGGVTGPHLHWEVFPLSPNFKNGYAGRVNPAPYISTLKTATEAEIKKAYLEILERAADAGGIKTYLKFTIASVRSDLMKSPERKRLEAKKATAAKVAAEKARAEAAKKASEATKAAAVQKALNEAKKAEEARVAAQAELDRIAEEQRIIKEEAEARAKAQADIAKKAKEDAMATSEESITKTKAMLEEVAASDVVQELISGVSKRTKLVVYFVGDTLLGLGLITPQIVALVHTQDPVLQGALLNGILATAGGFLLTMFGIFKSSKQ